MKLGVEVLLRIALGLVVAAVASSGPAVAQPAVDGLVPFRATYTVLNDGKPVGKSVQSLSFDPATRRYVFETRTEFRGLLRFAAPRPVIERSELVVLDGRVRPSTFTYEDGSRGGSDNFTLTFDWSTHRLAASSSDSEREWPLPDYGLDRASARVALMRDLAAGVTTGTYRIADPDEIRPYELRREDDETRTTALGELRTVRVVQQRPGSTRRTVTWASPALHFLAVRIEQQRADRRPVAFVIDSVEWLDPGAAGATSP